MESGVRKVVVFKVDRSNYCMDIKDVLEIIRVPQINKLPQTRRDILGVINLRNRIIPVLDLKKRCLDEYTSVKDETRVIISRIEEKEVGYLVDEVNEIMEIDSTGITATNEISIKEDIQFVEGVARIEENIVILLNTSKIICD